MVEKGTTVELHTLFLHLALMLFSAKILGSLFKKLSLPPVLGEVLAGIILGASFLNVIPLSDAIKVLAEIGVILLLFEVGLEADLQMLVKVGLWSFLVATVGALLPFLGGFVVSHYLFGLDLIASLFMGGALTATSIGITIRVLTDLGKHKENFAQIVLGAAVIDDILGVIILATLYEFAKTHHVEVLATGNLVFFIVLFFFIAPFIANLLASLLFWTSQKLGDKEIITPSIMGLILLAAWSAHKFGSPSILGSFAAGVSLSKNFGAPFPKLFKIDERVIETVEEGVRPLVWVLAPIFFVSVGLALNLRELPLTSLEFWAFSISLLIVAILGKVLAGFVIKGSLKEKLSIGFSMLPRGEVGLIFAEFGRSFKAINNVEYAVIIFVVALTTLLAPIFLNILLKKD
jgi:Kef-type K+ transport system membrane component KefB